MVLPVLKPNSHARSPLGPPTTFRGEFTMRFPPRDSALGSVLQSRFVRPVEAIAFWTAIVLPFLYVPLLFYGLETTAELATFFGLLGLNLVAFAVGHRYKRD